MFAEGSCITKSQWMAHNEVESTFAFKVAMTFFQTILVTMLALTSLSPLLAPTKCCWLWVAAVFVKQKWLCAGLQAGQRRVGLHNILIKLEYNSEPTRIRFKCSGKVHRGRERERCSPSHALHKTQKWLTSHLQQQIQWGAVKPMRETTDNKHKDITEMTWLYHELHLILFVHYNLDPVLITPQHLHMERGSISTT